MNNFDTVRDALESLDDQYDNRKWDALTAISEIDRLLKQALAQLEINRTNFSKGPSKSICKMLAGGNDDVIAAIKKELP